VARGINSALVLLYWRIGQRIRQDVLKEKRAEYGQRIFYALSRKLVAEFGRGFSQANLFHMARFAEVFPDPKIVSSLMTRLSWTHLRRIIYLDDALERDFYAEMCRIEQWNTRTLHNKIQSMLFERTALSQKPAKLAAIEPPSNGWTFCALRRLLRRLHPTKSRTSNSKRRSRPTRFMCARSAGTFTFALRITLSRRACNPTPAPHSS
jgi:hypothetical protein